MKSEGINEGGGGGKASPLSAPEGLITYKRRRRDKAAGSCSGLRGEGGASASDAEQTSKIAHQDMSQFNCGNGHCQQDKMMGHWRNILERVTQPVDKRDISIQNCIQRALNCGPIGSSRKSIMTDVHPKDRHHSHPNVQMKKLRHKGSLKDSLNAAQGPGVVNLNESRDSVSDQADIDVTMKYGNILSDVLISRSFALLCDLLNENFQGTTDRLIIDLRSILSKMKNGVYEESSELFNQDVKMIWEKFQKIGQDMSLLATNLLSILQASYQSEIGQPLGKVAADQKYKSANQNIGKEKLSADENATTCLESNRFAEVVQTNANPLYKICSCQECGIDADVKDSLVCDECEAIYHVHCINAAIPEIPTRSWYCSGCLAKRGSGEKDLASAQQDCLHQSCVACDRLEELGNKCTVVMNSGNDRLEESGSKGPIETNPGNDVVVSSSRECSVSSLDGEESPEPLSVDALRLCKQCGTCEDEDKRFLVCSNRYCIYKYYHIRCLRNSQVASQHQKPGCWYCPSCLCRACFTDKDDDLICMCDGCDEAYHTYCMKPPMATVPAGTWYCLTCNLHRIRNGMRKYEEWVLKRHSRTDLKIASGTGNKQSMDMLLSAAEKLSAEETMVSTNRSSR